MEKQLCIVHANCQGPPLLERLNLCPEFDEMYDCYIYTNYAKEPVPHELLERCSLFLYQHLGSEWGDLASESLLQQIPEDATSLCIPNMFFKGYWPTWSGEAGFDYRCTHLDKFVKLDLPPKETVMLFLRSDVTRLYDLLDMVSKTIEHEREREQHTPIKYLEVLIANYRDQRLFNTVNHPGPLLMNHVSTSVLDHLGFDSPPQSILEELGDPFPEFEQPIHPRIGDYFGWDFATTDTEFQIYGRRMSYARYVANYVMCQKSEIEDFIGYLQGAYIEI